jgi:hypothetical protein
LSQCYNCTGAVMTMGAADTAAISAFHRRVPALKPQVTRLLKPSRVERNLQGCRSLCFFGLNIFQVSHTHTHSLSLSLSLSSICLTRLGVCRVFIWMERHMYYIFPEFPPCSPISRLGGQRPCVGVCVCEHAHGGECAVSLSLSCPFGSTSSDH